MRPQWDTLSRARRESSCRDRKGGSGVGYARVVTFEGSEPLGLAKRLRSFRSGEEDSIVAALDCFEFGLSDSCRLKITLRGDEPVAWHVEKREYGMWVPGRHPLKRLDLAFWRPTRVVYRQNHVFRRAT